MSNTSSSIVGSTLGPPGGDAWSFLSSTSLIICSQSSHVQKRQHACAGHVEGSLPMCELAWRCTEFGAWPSLLGHAESSIFAWIYHQSSRRSFMVKIHSSHWIKNKQWAKRFLFFPSWDTKFDHFLNPYFREFTSKLAYFQAFWLITSPTYDRYN